MANQLKMAMGALVKGEWDHRRICHIPLKFQYLWLGVSNRNLAHFML